ncbi:MAG: AIR synthase-related protein, partial [Steroidobacteraceae bacterium]|nr:AIR synthase-related protein [Steroidobacteraceae bacterium]
YALIRKLLEVSKANNDTMLEGRSLYDWLLAPTRIYVKPMLALAATLPVHAFAHITGGGLTGNIPRVLPDGLEVILQRSAWPRSALWDWLQKTGNIADAEMYRTFNCGIGMVAIVPPECARAAIELLAQHGETASVIGSVQPGARGVVIQ